MFAGKKGVKKVELEKLDGISGYMFLNEDVITNKTILSRLSPSVRDVLVVGTFSPAGWSSPYLDKLI